MRIFITIICFFSLTIPTSAQESFRSEVKNYYRVNPFAGSFSSFVEALSSDSALLNKQIFKQTDTTGYFLKGNYKIFNPFSINADKVAMIFYESQIQINDVSAISYYSYQITASFSDNAHNRKAVLRDFKKMNKKFRYGFNSVENQSVKKYNSNEEGEIISYNNTGWLAPVVISWQTLSKTNQLALTIIIKIQQANNHTFLM